MTDRPGWPPEGYTAVGEYAFAPPCVPSELQVEQAEQFVFTQPAFMSLEEAQRRRNVIRLAIAAASNFMLPSQEGAIQKNFVPLIGGIVEMTIERHEETPVFTYNLLGDQ
jgi:hypothetical protein